MAKTNTQSTSEVQRVGKFGVVGVLNTLIDVTIYNLLSRGTTATAALVRANFVSTTIAMLFSFFANQIFVFQANRRETVRQALFFFPITAFGLYVLQNGTIFILTTYLTGVVNFGVSFAHLLGLSKFLSDAFIIKNGVKAAAIVVSMVWNYLMYKKVVFKK